MFVLFLILIANQNFVSLFGDILNEIYSYSLISTIKLCVQYVKGYFHRNEDMTLTLLYQFDYIKML